MNSDRHTIYVSYADADEEWVIHFVNGLKFYLRKQLGEIDEDFIWAKYMPLGTGNKQDILLQHLRASKYLLVIASPAYFTTIKNSEIDAFGKVDNLIPVEHNKVELPENLQLLNRYQFWYEDNKGRTLFYANPVPTPGEPQYYRLLAEMAYDIVKCLNTPQNRSSGSDSISTTEVANTVSSSEPVHVFINAVEKDRQLAIRIQQQLGAGIKSSVLPKKSMTVTPGEAEKELETNLLTCDTVIVLCGRAPKKWVYQQVKFVYKMQDERKNSNRSEFKIVAVFNIPPPDRLEQELGLQFPNLKIWNCVDIINECVPKFKQVAFS